MIRVTRGPEPEWFELALTANQHPQPNAATEILKKSGVHTRETAWIGTCFDAVIDNNSHGLDNLYRQINNLVQDLLAAKSDQSS